LNLLTWKDMIFRRNLIRTPTPIRFLLDRKKIEFWWQFGKTIDRLERQTDTLERQKSPIRCLRAKLP